MLNRTPDGFSKSWHSPVTVWACTVNTPKSLKEAEAPEESMHSVARKLQFLRATFVRNALCQRFRIVLFIIHTFFQNYLPSIYWSALARLLTPITDEDTAFKTKQISLLLLAADVKTCFYADHVLMTCCVLLCRHTSTVSARWILLSVPPRQCGVKPNEISIHSIAHKQHKHTLIAVSVHFWVRVMQS